MTGDVVNGIVAVISDPRFPLIAVIALIAGLVRGLTGFGSALIYVPLVSAVYEPRVAAATILLIDTLCSLPWTAKAAPEANWREVWPVSLASTLALPAGVALLLYVEPQILRWVISGLIAVALTALISGWRYHGRPTLIASLATGMIAGLGGGSVQIAAPPLLLFWLGGQNNAVTIRANIMVVLQISGLLSIIAYTATGVFTMSIVLLAFLVGIPFLAAIGVGARWFRGTSDTRYRRIAYLIIGIAVLVSLPVFDGLR